MSPQPKGSQREDRPTLPPIRDLFREELSRYPNSVTNSPPITLSRLRVSDEGDENVSPERDSLSGSLSRRMHRPSSGQAFLTSGSYLYRGPEYQEPATLRSRRGSEYDGNRTLPTIMHSRSFPPERSRVETSQELHRSALNHCSLPYSSISLQQPAYGTHEEPHRATDQIRRKFSHSIERSRGSQDVTFPSTAAHPWSLTTGVGSARLEEAERTPIARFLDAPKFTPANFNQHKDEDNAGLSSNKYECSFCRKGFNRPSSLKIHLNSHTGAKPFVCPFNGCGRSFSVLSNMRRHSRVHNQDISKEKELSSDEGSIIPTAAPSSVHTHIADSSTDRGNYSSRWHQRRDSSASISSTSSRRSRSTSLVTGESDDASRPEKRLRHNKR